MDVHRVCEQGEWNHVYQCKDPTQAETSAGDSGISSCTSACSDTIPYKPKAQPQIICTRSPQTIRTVTIARERTYVENSLCKKLDSLTVVPKPPPTVCRVPSPFAQDKDGDTYLIVLLACGEQHAKEAEDLIRLASPAQLNLQNNSGQTAAHIAAYLGQQSALRLLIDRHANLTKLDTSGQTPLHILAHRGWTDCIKEVYTETEFTIIEVKRMLTCLLGIQDYAGYTPLHLAVIADHPDTVERLCLVAKVARLKVATSGYEALHLAVENSSLDSIKYLMEIGDASVDAIADNGVTPLHIAAASDDYSTVGSLLVWGADPSIRTLEGELAADLTTDPEIKAMLVSVNTQNGPIVKQEGMDMQLA